MGRKSLIIIGAGIAGLSAGCYAQMNGYDSCIYEAHSIPGGLCTSWTRRQHTFDGSIDWLTGAEPDGMFHPLWQEVGALKDIRFHHHDEYCRYRSHDGRVITLYTDPDRLKAELVAHAPEDRVPIERLCAIIRVFKGFKAPVAMAPEVMGSLDGIAMMVDLLKQARGYHYFFTYGKISMAEFASAFRSSLLRDALTSIWNNNMPVYMFAGVLAWCSNGTAGYPDGGSLRLAQNIARRYESLGGQILYGQRVEKILVSDGKVTGIRLADGSEAQAAIVISAADYYATVNGLLGGDYTPQAVEEWFRENAPFPPYIQVSLGINRNMGNESRLICVRPRDPLIVAGKAVSCLVLHNYALDRTLSPEGKTAFAVRLFTEYEYWAELHKNRERYREEKQALAAAVIDELERDYPGLAAQVEVVDVATPATYSRYTGNWRGAPMGWLPTTANFGKSLPKTLPGLEGFYAVGHWITPGGGVPVALKTARDALQIICRKDGKPFTTLKSQK
jgi:phytoene dehydrogenase-like protein